MAHGDGTSDKPQHSSHFRGFGKLVQSRELLQVKGNKNDLFLYSKDNSRFVLYMLLKQRSATENPSTKSTNDDFFVACAEVGRIHSEFRLRHLD